MKATSQSELDPESMAAIRDLLASEPKASDIAQSPDTHAAARGGKKRAGRRAAKVEDAQPKAKRAADQFEPLHDANPGQSGGSRRSAGLMAELTRKVRGFRPKPKHILFWGTVLLLLFRPWLVVGLVFITAFILTGILLILGYDGFWHRIMHAMRWYAERRPARAEVLHQRLDTFAMRFDAFLDRFPEGSVDGLYLPDFGEIEKAEARHDAALDRRFDSLRET